MSGNSVLYQEIMNLSLGNSEQFVGKYYTILNYGPVGRQAGRQDQKEDSRDGGEELLTRGAGQGACKGK
jgi:hypothetical protein